MNVSRERARLDRDRCRFVYDVPGGDVLRCLLDERTPHEGHLIEYQDGRRFRVTPEPEQTPTVSADEYEYVCRRKDLAG